MTDHRDDLVRLRMALNEGLPIPPDLAKWLCKGIDNFDAGYCKSLCVALGLRGPGIRSKQNRELIKRRDFLLKLAVKSCCSYPGEPIWNQCKTMSELVRRYPRSKGENPLLDPLFELKNQGVVIPDTPEKIYNRIKPLLERRLLKK